MSNLTREELEALFGEVGEDVSVHRSVVVFGGKRIRIASHVRIDCFALLSAGGDGIEIGHHVHLAAGDYLFGSGGKITLEPFSNISGRVSFYTASDDYTHGYMGSPLVPDHLKRVTKAPITIGRHTIIGTGSVVMPGVTTGLGASIGALSFVNRDVPDFTIVAGVPAKKIGMRGRLFLDLEGQVPT